MSIYVNTAAVTMFDPFVKQTFQDRGFKLRNAARVRNNVVGSTVKFRKIGTAMAVQKAIQDMVHLNDTTYSEVTLTLQNYNVSDMSDIFSQAEINFDERTELAKTFAMGIGRRADQQVINALVASGTTNAIVAGGTGFTYEKFLTMNEYHSQNSSRTPGRMHVAVDAAAEADLLADDEFINKRYTEKALLDNGATLDGLDMFGYMWHVFGTMPEGGIPVAGGTHSAFSWNADAMGIAIGIDFRTTVSFENLYRSFLVSSDFKANAIAIDPVGIVKIDYV